MIERQTNGIVIGVVTSLEDEENIGRVKVKYPNWEDQESDWARIAAPMAGNNRGAFFRPEKDDEVLVAFEQGDPRRPYIIGALWSKTDQPPTDDGKAKENNWRFIKSRSGHIIKLDDTKGQEKIEFIDKDGARRVVIDSANQKIQVICDTGDVEVQAASGKVLVEASEITLRANKQLTLTSNGPVTIQGKTVNIN
jgi:uncharacterized protein involved in type VI secretion and phage assembly